MAEPILATRMYPMAQQSSTVVQAQWPAVGALPMVVGVKYENISTSGNKEVIYIREEETRKINLIADGLEVQQWQQFATQVGIPGNQFEFCVDRHLGMTLTCQNTLQDITNGNLVSATGAVSYSLVNGKIAAIVASGQGCAVSWTSSFQAPIGGEGGTVVMTFVPLFPDTTGATQMLMDFGLSSALTGRFFLYKAAIAQLIVFGIYGNVGSAATAYIETTSWTANSDTITLIGQWTPTGSLSFWASKNGGRLQVSTYIVSPGSMAVTMVGTTGSLGRVQDGTNPGPMKLLHFATYKYPFEDVTLLSSYFPLGRNYYDKAEFADQGFAFNRASPTIDLWQVEMKLRQGF